MAPPKAETSSMSSAISEAQSIVEAAEKRAAALSAKTEAAYNEAKATGYAEGVEQGRAEVANTAVRLIQDSTKVADSMANEAARLAIAICQSIINEHIQVSESTVKAIAINALQQAVVGSTVMIQVHPDDENELSLAQNELRRLTGGIEVGIEVDPSISRGGCVVRTDFGEVDATIETLLAQVAQRLGVSDA